MAYGLLLYKEINTPHGKQRVEIYKDGYSGSAIEIAGLHRDGITISKDSNDLTQPITTSVLTLSLSDCGEVDYSQFFTPNSTLFKVIWKTDEGSGWATRWTGFITPDSYTENLAYRDTLTLTARDNIGRLNDYDFSLPKGQLVTVRSLITQSLTLAGVAMDIKFETAKRATVPADTAAVDGLVSTTLFQGMSWHDALETVLLGLGLTLSWCDDDRIEIRDISQPRASSQDAFFINKSGYRQIRPAWKNLHIEQDYGLRDNFYEGQFSAEDCGNERTFTPPASSKWSVTGSMALLNPYRGAAEPYETIFPPIGLSDAMTDALTYSERIPSLARGVEISLNCSNSYWGGGGIRGINTSAALASGGSIYNPVKYYALRYRFNIFFVTGGTRYVMREAWEEYNPATIEEPYLYFSMPSTSTGIALDEVIKLYISSFPNDASGTLELVVYPPLAYYNEDDGESECISSASRLLYGYGKITNIAMTVDEGVGARAKNVAINGNHNINGEVRVGFGQVPLDCGNALLYLGGIFYTDVDSTPLTAFKRDANGEIYDLLELVGREYISYQNAAYNALSGSLMAEAAFRFDKSVTFEENDYRIVGASLAILSNTLTVQLLQQEADFDDEDYTITEVDSEGGSSTHTGSGSVPQGTPSTVLDLTLIETVMAAGLAKAYARIGSLEDWLREPSFEELAAQIVNAEEINTRRIWLSETAYIEVDSNGYIHTNTGFYSDGFVSAGGLDDSGGGGGDLDLGAMWSSLINGTIATADVTSGTDIHPDHLPALSVSGTGITGSVASSYDASAHTGSTVLTMALTTTGVTPGTYNRVTVDGYGRITAGSDSGADDIEVPLTAGVANLAARVSSLEDWLRNPAIEEMEIVMLNVADYNLGRLITNDELANNKVTIAGVEVALGGSITTAQLEAPLGTTAMVSNIAGLTGRVASLEDWLRNPAMQEATIADLGGGSARFAGYVDMYDTLTVAGLISGGAGLKLTGTVKKIWFGESAYIELDANGYLHTNIGFYSDNFISAGGAGSGGSSGGVDLGAVWTSLINQPIATADVTTTTKIVADHLPIATTAALGVISVGGGLSVSNAGALSLTPSGITAGTYKTVTVDSFGRVTAGLDPSVEETPESVYTNIAGLSGRVSSLEDWLKDAAFGEVSVEMLNAADFNLGRTIENAELTNNTITIAGTAVALGNSMSKDNLRSLLEINNVENTKLSTWAGSTNITTLGTITTGTWHGSAIANDYIANARVRINGEWVSLGSSYSTASITGGTAGTSSATSGLSFSIPYVTMSSYGIVTGYGTHTHGISAQQLIDGIGNNAVAKANYASSAGSASTATYATYDENGNRLYTAYGASLYAQSGALKLLSTSGATLSTMSGADLVSALANAAVNRATGDENGNRLYTTYGASLSAAANALTLVSKNGSTLSTITGANIVTVLGSTAVGRATADGDGNTISSTYLKLSGGTMTGDIYMRGGNYGRRIFFGDGEYCYLGELADDKMTVYGDKGITFLTRSNSYAVSIGQKVNNVVTDTPLTVWGRINLTDAAYLEYNSSNAGIHASKGIYSDYYITAGSTSSSSDARLKRNLRPVKLTVRDVAAAPAVEFDWVDERMPGSGAGSIAQYWQEFLPWNIRTFDEDGMLSMEYGNVALLAAIITARAVESQEERIERLEKKVAELETKLLTI